MRKLFIALLLFVSQYSFAQNTDQFLLNRNDSLIRNKPTLPVRTANQFELVINSKASLLGSYSNPAWITSLAWNKITGTPTTLAGYGITARLLTGTNTFTGPVVDVGTTTNTFTFQVPSIAVTPNYSFGLQNPTAAAAGAQQYSPMLWWEGQGWRTNATAESQSVRFGAYVLPVQGAANPSGLWNLAYSINGAAIATGMSWNSATGGLSLISIGGNVAPHILLTSGTVAPTSPANGSMWTESGRPRYSLGGQNTYLINTNPDATGVGDGSVVVGTSGAGQVRAFTGFTFASSTLSVPGRIAIASTGVNYSQALNSAWSALLAVGGAANIRIGGGITLQATNADTYAKIEAGSTITTASTNQVLRGYNDSGTYTINHTGASVYGVRFAPTINGSQTPTHVYALQATTGKIGLANYTNGTPIAGDLWYNSGGGVFQARIGTAGNEQSHYITTAATTAIQSGQIAYGASTNGVSTSGTLTSISGFTFASSTLSVPGSVIASYSSPATSVYRSSLGGTATANSIAIGMTVSGSLTMRSTASDILNGFNLSMGLTTGSTAQEFRAYNTEVTFTANHANFTARGFRFGPAFAGSQLATASAVAWEHYSGFVQWASVLTPAQITVNQTDYNPPGWTNGGAPYGASIVRLSTDSSRNITSWAGGVEGRLSIKANVGSFPIVLKHDDGATGTAANRYSLVNAADINVPAGGAWLEFYDDTSDRIRVLSFGGAGISGLSTNRVPYATSATTLADGPYWDNARVGIGAAPTYDLDIQKSSGSGIYSRVMNTSTGESGLIIQRTGGTAIQWIQQVPSGSTDLRFYNGGDLFTFTTAGLFTAANVTATGLGGGGTQMVTANNTGVLGVAAIPAGISGLTTGRVPFAGSSTTLVDAVNMTYSDAGTAGTLTIQNDASTSRTTIGAGSYGAAITIADDIGFNENIILSAGNGGEPSITISDEGDAGDLVLYNDLVSAGAELQVSSGAALTLNAIAGSITLDANGAGNDVIVTPTDDLLLTIPDAITATSASVSVTTTAAALIDAGTSLTLNAASGSIILDANGAGNDITIDAVDDVLIVSGSDVSVSTLAGTGTRFVTTTSTGVLGATANASVALLYGDYTPTLTNETNVTSSVASQCQYSQVGGTVTVSCKVNVTYTLGTANTVLGISLPVSSAFSTAEQAAAAATTNAVDINDGRIISDATNDRLSLVFTSGAAGAPTFWFTVLYRIDGF